MKRTWRKINIFANLSRKFHSVTRKLERSQMRIRYFLRSELIRSKSRGNEETGKSHRVNFQPFAGRSSFSALCQKN